MRYSILALQRTYAMASFLAAQLARCWIVALGQDVVQPFVDEVHDRLALFEGDSPQFVVHAAMEIYAGAEDICLDLRCDRLLRLPRFADASSDWPTSSRFASGGFAASAGGWPTRKLVMLESKAGGRFGLAM